MEAPAGVRNQVPLAPLTTLELGGPADRLLEAEESGTLVEALRWAHHEGLTVTLLGGGSNVVVADGGVTGLVVRLSIRGTDLRRFPDEALVTVSAGEPWDQVVAWTLDEGLVGLECLSGIPGFSGATPIQNVGAYGRELSELLAGIRVVDRQSMLEEWLEPADCDFGYRDSRFRREPERFVVLAIRLRLGIGGPAILRYGELARALEARATAPTPATVREAVLDLRRSKSMVIDPADPNRRSVGSFFVNPVVAAARCAELAERAGGEEPPCYPAGDGLVKLPAAWLIDHAGFAKGLRRGPVGISSRHSLALVHHGAGTTAELVALAREVRASVRDRFGIDLQPEPVFLGFNENDPTAG